MEKTTNRKTILVALILLLLIAAVVLSQVLRRERSLSDVCAIEDWTDTMLAEHWTKAGGASTQLTLDESRMPDLRALLAGVTVKKTAKTDQLPIPSVQISVQTAQGELCTLCVGENGLVIFSRQTDGGMQSACCKTDSAGLYAGILNLCAR